MSQQTVLTPKTRSKSKVERPKLWKVILLNDDYTPREFVVTILKLVFRMGEERASAVMLTAHRRGACVIAVYAKDIAETKANEAMDLSKSKGYPLAFSTEPEESRRLKPPTSSMRALPASVPRRRRRPRGRS